MHTIFSFVKSHIVLATTLAILVVAGAAISGRIATSKKNVDTNTSNIRQVTLVPVSTFRTGSQTISADGVVESVSQVDLKSQLSAPLSRVNVSVGDTVYTGQIIAELQNADIRAQLDQARATLALAKGQYTTGGVSVTSAEQAALTAARDSYIKADNVVHSQIEPFLYNPGGTSPLIYGYMSNIRQSDRIRDQFADFTNVFISWKKAIDNTTANQSSGTVISLLDLSEANLSKIESLLNELSSALTDIARNGSNDPQIETWKSTVNTARTTISGSMAALTAAETTLSNASVTHSTPAEAQISIAQAGVQNLEAQLAKTIIRTPISGKIAAVPLRAGELASPGQLIATVVGAGGLQVKAFASGEDLTRIARGARALIEGKISGVVTAVAPSVNQTNKKVEVVILVSDSRSSGLVVGQNVQTSIAASVQNISIGAPTYLLPIQNVKIVPGDAYVLTIDSESKIQRNPVVLGAVRGEFVEVKSGLSDEMNIVSPVYELNEGEVVRVQEQ